MHQDTKLEAGELLFSGILIMMLLAFALIGFVVAYQKKLIRQQAELQKIQQASQKALLHASIEAEEQERKRIGSDLHDEIGSSLSAAKMMLAQLSNRAAATDTPLITSISSILSNSVQDIRNISQNLYPAILARFGLAEAIRNLSGLWASAQGVTIEIEAEIDVSLTYQQELALYRIAQELVNNAMKHAQASHIAIQLIQEPASLRLLVTDNGRGFDYVQTQQAHKAGLGLRSLEARVSLLDASLRVESAPRQGTRIEVAMPLPMPYSNLTNSASHAPTRSHRHS